MPTPSPLPLWTPFGADAWADLGAVERHVRLSCAAEGACAARAAAEDWAAWSCLACECYAPTMGAHVVEVPVARLRASPWSCPGGAGPDEGDALVVTAELHDGAHLVISDVEAYSVALRAGALALRVVPVARGRCPICGAHWHGSPRVLEPVLPDGYCPVGRHYLDAVSDGSGFDVVEGVASRLYLEHERRRRNLLLRQQIELIPSESTS